MRRLAFIALLASLVGVCWSSGGEIGGQEWIYKVKGISVLGLPSSLQNEVQIDQTVRISPLSQGTFLINVEDVKVRNLESSQSGTDSSSQSTSTSSQQRSESTEDVLREVRAFEVHISPGGRWSLKVAEGSPEWAINLYRGIVFQLGSFWRDVSPTDDILFGGCRARREFSQVGRLTESPQTIASNVQSVLRSFGFDQSQFSLNSERSHSVQDRILELVQKADFQGALAQKHCGSGAKAAILVRSVDLSDCEHETRLSLGPQWKLNSSRSSPGGPEVLSVSIGCGRSGDDYSQLGVISLQVTEVEQVGLPLFRGITTATAVLHAIRNPRGTVRGLTNTRTIHNLNYQFHKLSDNMESESSESDSTSSQEEGTWGPLESPQETIERIVGILRGLTRDRMDGQEGHVFHELESLVSLIRQLPLKHLNRLYGHISTEAKSSGNNKLKRVLLNGIWVSGTRPAAHIIRIREKASPRMNSLLALTTSSLSEFNGQDPSRLTNIFQGQAKWDQVKDILRHFKDSEIWDFLSGFGPEEDNAIMGWRKKVEYSFRAIPIDQIDEIPTILGFPLTYRLSVPLILSTRGDLTSTGRGKNSRIQANLNIHARGEMKGRMGLRVPYDQKEYEVGYRKAISLELPLSAVIQRGPKGQMTLALSPAPSSGGVVRLLSATSAPYTYVIRDPWAPSQTQSPHIPQGMHKSRIELGSEDMGYLTLTKQSRGLHSNMALDMDPQRLITNTLIFTTAIGKSKEGYDLCGVLSGWRSRLSTALPNVESSGSEAPTLQYLLHAEVKPSPQTASLILATGNAVQEVVRQLPSIPTVRAIRKSIFETTYNNPRQSGCMKINIRHQQATMETGISCSEADLETVGMYPPVPRGGSRVRDIAGDYALLFAAPQGLRPVPASLTPQVMDKIDHISALCPRGVTFRDMNPLHMQALFNLTALFREKESGDELNALALRLRDHPEMNYKLWLRALLHISSERPDFVALPPPNPLSVNPDHFATRETIDALRIQAQLSEDQRTCVPMDGRYTVDVGAEHALWYFREDFLFNAMHEYWHIWYTKDPASLVAPNRRGELNYYYHHNIIARYRAERMAFGFQDIVPLNLGEGAVVEEGYDPHLTEINSNNTWGYRTNNSIFTNITKWVELRELVSEDIDLGRVIAENGTEYGLNNTLGIDLLGDIIEASTLSVNPIRYDKEGLHNEIHDALGRLSHNKVGVMGHTATAVRDPIFYRWHLYIDNLFLRHKATLPPYHRSQGELRLEVPDVQIQDVSVQTEKGLGANVLETFFQETRIAVPFAADVVPVTGGMIQYCVKTLNHTLFTYKIQINSKEAKKGTIRIFLAPRFDVRGQRIPLEEQRKMFFQMDEIKVNLKGGLNEIERSSVEALESLTRPWDYYNNTEHTGKLPACGCGWPHHLLLPRGTPQGMTFDLVAILTDGGLDEPPQPLQGPPPNCGAAHILCGKFNQLYPSTKPMGYPFDRPIPPTGKGYLEDFADPIPNINYTQIKIFHQE